MSNGSEHIELSYRDFTGESEADREYLDAYRKGTVS